MSEKEKSQLERWWNVIDRSFEESQKKYKEEIYDIQLRLSSIFGEKEWELILSDDKLSAMIFDEIERRRSWRIYVMEDLVKKMLDKLDKND